MAITARRSRVMLVTRVYLIDPQRWRHKDSETDRPCSVLSPFKALGWTSSEQTNKQIKGVFGLQTLVGGHRDLNPGPPACESGVIAITLRGAAPSPLLWNIFLGKKANTNDILFKCKQYVVLLKTIASNVNASSKAQTAFLHSHLGVGYLFCFIKFCQSTPYTLNWGLNLFWWFSQKLLVTQIVAKLS